MYPTEASIHEFMDHDIDINALPPIEADPTGRELRPYQDEAREAVLTDWGNGIRRVGVVLPTGTGKSSVLGSLISACYHRGLRIVILAHRAELLDQIVKETRAVDPLIPIEHFGLVRAEYDDHTAPIVVAMFQTLANSKRAHALGKRDVIFVDETHHIIAEGYLKTFTTLGGYDGAFFCGFTATMYRAEMTKGKSAAVGLGDVVQKVSYEKTLRWAIENGYLVPPRGLTVRIGELNELNKIKNVAGDFNQKDLAEVMEAAVGYTCDAIEMHAMDRRSIVFAASVAAAQEIADQLNARGNLTAEAIVGTDGYDARKPIYDRFRSGETRVMVNVGVLTEGADFPMCDSVVLARPTRSRILYSQMVGRALRLYNENGHAKEDALVLDLSGTTRHMKLIHLSELVNGLGIVATEVDEDGNEIEIPLCPNTNEPVNLCMCEDCVAERTPEKRTRVTREGPVDMTPIDLLAEGDSDVLWLMTPAGINFIPLDEGWNVFVWPRGGDHGCGQYAVGSINTRKNVKVPGGYRPQGGFIDLEENIDGTTTEVYLPLVQALRRAEEWVIDQRMTLPNKNQSWRRRSQAPSPMQEQFARRLGIPSFERMTKGRLSDEISIHLAANVLDSAVAPRSGGENE